MVVSRDDIVAAREAPEMPGYPLVGVLPKLRRDAVATFSEMVRTRGEVVRFRILTRESVLVSNPELAKTVLRTASDYRRTNRILKPLLGSGLLTNDGPMWRRSRKAMQPAFHTTRVEELSAVTVRTTSETLDALCPPGGERTLDIADAMRQLTLRIALRRLFGTTISADSQRALHAALEFALEEVWRRRWSLLPWDQNRPTLSNLRFRRAIKHIDRAVKAIVDQRRRSVGHFDDLLAKILAARDEETGKPFDEQQIIDEVKVMMLTAHDSVSNTLAWACYSLCRHPAASERLDRELAAVLGDGDPSVTHLPELPWLRGVIQETLRLYPPAWIIGRSAPSEETTLGDYRLPPNAHVLVCPYVIHRLPQYWPDPEAFDPSRFASDPRPNARWPGYLPFGTGPHICIGESYAFTLVRLVLAMLWRNFRFEIVPSHPIEPAFATTLTPRHGVLVRIRSRSAMSRSAA